MTTPLRPARRIILRSAPPPLPAAHLHVVSESAPAAPAPSEAAPASQHQAMASTDVRDSVIPDSFIRDLRAMLADPEIPRDALLPDLDSWLDHDLPRESSDVLELMSAPPADFAAQLGSLQDYLRALYARRVLHPALDPSAPLENLPVPAPPMLSIWRWIWLALLGG